MTADKQKIAILGGGVGAISTAWALTSDPACRERYEITIYQMGWRIGGKGACGRNPDFHYRIEEHGPHVWFGFYWNAFNAMREALAECRQYGLSGNTPFKDFASSFTPNHEATVMEFHDGQWSDWPIDLPAMPGEPGVGAPATLWQLFCAGVEWALARVREFEKEIVAAEIQAAKGHWLRAAKNLLKDAAVVGITIEESIVHCFSDMAPEVVDTLRNGPVNHTAKLGFIQQLMERLQEFIHEHSDAAAESIRRKAMIADTAVALLLGMIVDDVFNKGFDQLDDQDYSEWLKSHGCRNPWSPPVQAVYDAAFAFSRGITNEVKNRTLAAGSALHASLRMYFAYQGAYCYKMNGGMGDTIFAPFYLALKNRGVKFKFFHQVERLHSSADLIQSIDFSVQAHTIDGEEYDPLVSVPWGNTGAVLPSWLNRPDYGQLIEGDELKAKGINLDNPDGSNWPGTSMTLRHGVDFDHVVLGISFGSLPTITAELREKPEWAAMLDNIQTVATLSAQMWMTRTPSELGWEKPERPSQTPLVAGFVQPVDTWSDMSQTLPCERWPSPAPVSVSYFCGPLTDPDTDESQLERVKRETAAFLKNHASSLWPRAFDSGDFDYSLLLAPESAKGVERLDYQYYRANLAGSERYVLSVPGTRKYRLAPDWPGYRNLVLAGDWTKNWISAGCVEAAMISGKLAARALGAKLSIPGEDPNAHWAVE